MIPFTNELGLRDYRCHPAERVPRARWPWLVLGGVLVGLTIGVML